MEALEVVQDGGTEVRLARSSRAIDDETGAVGSQLVQGCKTSVESHAKQLTLQHHFLFKRVTVLVLVLGFLERGTLLDGRHGTVDRSLEPLEVVGKQRRKLSRELDSSGRR